MDPRKRIPLKRRSEEMCEIVNQVLRDGVADKEPEGGYSDIWCDQGPYHAYYADRHFSATYTPFGIHAVFQAFLRRMRGPQAGETKRSIRRDIQSNPNLHPKLKKDLLKRLVKAAVRYDGRGHREMDSVFGERIRSVDTKENAEALRLELENHPCILPHIQENLLYNLANYARGLTA